jgi:hypothetical protein
MEATDSTRRGALRTIGGAAVGLLAGAASVAAATTDGDGRPTDHDATPDCESDPPVPVHDVSPARTFDDGYVVAAGETVTLDASDAFDPDGDVVDWEWALTYGRKSGERVEHAWRRPGGKDVTLTVTDDDGLTASADVYVYVRGRR